MQFISFGTKTTQVVNVYSMLHLTEKKHSIVIRISFMKQKNRGEYFNFPLFKRMLYVYNLLVNNII